MINIIVALPCEARPLIDTLHLHKRDGVNAFPLYHTTEHEDAVNLMVCGLGSLAAATATAYLQGLQQQQPAAAWLNLGIAGSRAFELGDAVLAHRVIDNTSGQRFYPGLCFELPCATAEVISVDTPETRYTGNAVYDMEAAGFYSAAMRFAPSEMIHCVKVISDTQEQSIASIDEAMVIQLITQRLPEIRQLLTRLGALANELAGINAIPDAFHTISARWRFTVSQQHQLKNLLWRWQALATEPVSNAIDAGQFKHGKQVLQHLEARLAALPLHFGSKTKPTDSKPS